MNYERLYYQIIDNAKRQQREKGDLYFERHHIIPQSLGGNNSKLNLVLLTAREHFICHVLLVKIHRHNTNNYKKMLHALMLMKGSNVEQPRYINSKLYDFFKRDYSIIRSEARKGKTLTDEHKHKISATLKGRTTSEETRQLISEKAKARKRKPFSDEYKAKMSAIMKDRHRWRNEAE